MKEKPLSIIEIKLILAGGVDGLGKDFFDDFESISASNILEYEVASIRSSFVIAVLSSSI